MNSVFHTIPCFRESCDGTYDCREGCTMLYYTHVTQTDYNAYLKTLTADGFAVLQERTLDGNCFAALKKDVQVNCLFTPCDNTLRITASAVDQTPCFTETTCTGDCTTTFYGFENDQTLIDCGMCLLVQCPDYSFFVVDSGHYFQFNDNDRIYKFMRERTPDGQKVVVNGWFITHGHSDHVSKLLDFLRYNTGDVVIEGFYQNLLPAEYPLGEDSNPEERALAVKLFRELEAFPAPVYKLHSGMRFYIRNLCFDVLSTHEDIYPEQITDYNDSSCVLMLHAEGSKVFIPGDAAVLASRVLEARYAETLRCDVIQVAHHGHTGLSARCYELLCADTAVFPVTRIFYEEDIQRHEANRRILALSAQQFVTGDGTVCIPLPYDRDTVYKLPDETFEDFAKIKRLWRYVYTDERQKELYDLFLQNGGDAEKMLLPTSYKGFIEPKPPIEE